MPRRAKKYEAWNFVRNYVDRTLEMINYGDKSVKYVEKGDIYYCDWKFKQTSCTTKRNIRKDTYRLNVRKITVPTLVNQLPKRQSQSG